MGKCPFGMKSHKGCAFYRVGVRIEDGTGKQTPFEECAVNVIADCLENLVIRNISLQKEMNLVRNETETTNVIFANIAARQKQTRKQIGG